MGRSIDVPRDASTTARSVLLVVPFVLFGGAGAMGLLPSSGELTIFGTSTLWRVTVGALAIAATMSLLVDVALVLRRTPIVQIRSDMVTIHRWGRSRQPIRLEEIRRASLESNPPLRRWTLKLVTAGDEIRATRLAESEGHHLIGLLEEAGIATPRAASRPSA